MPINRDARHRLLTAAVDHVTAGGVSDLSLRGLAAALGTSHRMLIYHFKSKEGLLVEIVRAMEDRQRAALADLDREIGTEESPATVARRFWHRLADPQLWPHERLLFELYGQALQGRAGTVGLLDDIVHAWLGPLTELGRRHGMSEPVARVRARLGVAVVRGLLLDLLTTGDRAAVDEAMECFIADYEAART